MMDNKLLKLLLSLFTMLALAACTTNPYGGGAPSYHYSDDYSVNHSPDIDTTLIHVTKRLPQHLTVGQTFESAVEVEAKKPVQDVVITDTVPAGTTVVKTDPVATQQGNTLTWKVSQMDRGDAMTLRTWLKADQTGLPSSCTTASATPRTCHQIFIGKPQLIVEKTGPGRVRMGSKFDYQITVTNAGNVEAKNVKLSDNLPSELYSASNQQMTYDIGDLAPGKSASTIVVHAVANKRGNYCNMAQATSDNHSPVDAEACTTVYQPMVNISKTGTTTALIGKSANYTVNVRNSGDVVLSNVVVTDMAPDGTRIIPSSVSDNGSVQGSAVNWTVDQIAPGETKKLNLALISNTAGRLCNQAQVKAGDLSDMDTACTVWQGVPSLLVQLMDTRDSLLVGDTTQYKLSVTNQGTAADSNVNIQVTFPDTIQPLSSDNGAVNGNTVTFTVPSLAAKQTVNYTVNAKAVSVGSKKVIMKVITNSIKTPVVEEESTTVY